MQERTDAEIKEQIGSRPVSVIVNVLGDGHGQHTSSSSHTRTLSLSGEQSTAAETEAEREAHRETDSEAEREAHTVARSDSAASSSGAASSATERDTERDTDTDKSMVVNDETEDGDADVNALFEEGHEPEQSATDQDGDTSMAS